MALPIVFSPGYVTVKRPVGSGNVSEEDASYEGLSGETDFQVVATRLRCQISKPSGSETVSGGDEEIVTFECFTDPFDFQPEDVLVDPSGVEYEVVWAVTRNDIPLVSHSKLEVQRFRGQAS